MSARVERSVRLLGEPHRVWEKGEGEPLGFLAGLGGLAEWTPFLDRLAQRRRVIVPSLPGFPGAPATHKQLDGIADWVTATLDLLEACGLDGAELVGHSLGGMLAAEVAAFSRASVKRLVLLAPLGLFDEKQPVADVWARRPEEVAPLFSTKPAEFAAARLAPPNGGTPEQLIEFQVIQARAQEAAARLLWPIPDLGLAKRLHRITCPVRLVWGTEDRIVPFAYAKAFEAALRGPTEIRGIAGAGHALDVDAPERTAEEISSR
jgi:pimeloyl-ACP methyl ester carboxylesterase